MVAALPENLSSGATMTFFVVVSCIQRVDPAVRAGKMVKVVLRQRSVPSAQVT
jgi:hypothetical protein